MTGGYSRVPVDHEEFLKIRLHHLQTVLKILKYVLLIYQNLQFAIEIVLYHFKNNEISQVIFPCIKPTLLLNISDSEYMCLTANLISLYIDLNSRNNLPSIPNFFIIYKTISSIV